MRCRRHPVQTVYCEQVDVVLPALAVEQMGLLEEKLRHVVVGRKVGARRRGDVLGHDYSVAVR